MDLFDRKIADVLQRDCRSPPRCFQPAFGLSVSATYRRIDLLRRSGAIRAEAAVLEPKAFGLSLTFIVEITLEKVRNQEVAEIKARLGAAPEIQQIYNVTGEGDLLLIVVARDMEHYEAVSRATFASDPLVRRYRTSVVMDRVKVGLALAVLPADGP